MTSPAEPPDSVTVQAEAPPAEPHAEVTAVAAGAALSESGHASELAAEAHVAAESASEEAETAIAAAAAASQNAESAQVAAATTESKLDRLVSMMEPIYNDYARRVAEENAKPEVSEVDAADTGTPSGDRVPDSGPERHDGEPAAPRRRHKFGSRR